MVGTRPENPAAHGKLALQRYTHIYYIIYFYFIYINQGVTGVSMPKMALRDLRNGYVTT
jgi:hypothetical protein